MGESVADRVQAAWDNAPFSGVELKARRLHMGMSTEDAGALFGVKPRSVQRWEAGQRPVPPFVGRLLVEREAHFHAFVEDFVRLALEERADGHVVDRLGVGGTGDRVLLAQAAETQRRLAAAGVPVRIVLVDPTNVP